MFRVALLLCPLALWSQSTTHLGGTVYDSSGALLTGVNVTVKSRLTGLTRAAVSNSFGLFRFTELPIGAYDLVLAKPGFQDLRQGVQLVTAQTADLTLTMQIAGVTESVGVTAEAPLVQTASAALQSSVTQKQMQDLPLNGRNPLQLVALTAGAVITRTGTVGGQQDNEGLSVNGQRVTQNNFRLDGSNYTNRYFNSVPVMPNPDTLEEFTVQSGNYNARAAGSGAVVEMSTRSGSNGLHWSAFEFLRNTKLNARNFFQLRRPPFKLNQFGGTVGGPIRRDRTFFFASYQRTARRSAPSSTLITTPDEFQRQGDFSRISNPIVDPLTRAVFPGNRIPAARIDRIASEVVRRFVPLPNRGAQYDSLQNQDLDDHQYLVKVDHALSAKNNLSARWFDDFNDFQRPTGSLAGFYAANMFRNRTLTVRDTHSFGSAFTMTNSFTANRFARTQIPLAPGLVTMQDLGVKVPMASDIDIYPGIRFNGGGFNLFSGGALQQIPQGYVYHGGFLWVRGKHTVQFGIDADRVYTFNVDHSNVPGQWVFNGQRTALATIARSGFAAADVLLGLPNTFNQGSSSRIDMTEARYHFWIQDDWKAAPGLTLNLGLRWEPWLPPVDTMNSIVGWRNGQQSTVAPDAPRGIVYPGDAGVADSVFPRDWNNLGPRVGFAWEPARNARTVIRGGYGIYFDSIQGAAYNRSFEMQPSTVRTNLTNVPTLADPYANYPGGTPFPAKRPSLADFGKYKFVRPVSGGVVDTATVTGYTQNWNLTVERQLRSDLAVSIGYVGNHAIKISGARELNPAVFGPGATTANSDARRVYASLGIGPMFIQSPYQFANYNAMQINVTKRPTRGLTLMANYTWGKIMDIISSSQTGQRGPRDPFNAWIDRGPADFDVTHRSTVSFVYETPRVKRAALLFGDWQVNGILTLASGLPFTVVSGRDNSLTAQARDSAELIGDPARPASANRLAQWFNTAAFTQNAIGTFGNVGRNSLRGPGVASADLAIFKNFPLTERLVLQFRAESFNTANRANFDNPTANVNSVNNGRILSAADPRVFQFGLKLRY